MAEEKGCIKRFSSNRRILTMYHEELKIPLERVAILIGKKGSIKSKIQKATNTKIKVSSRDGLVEIDGKESLNVYDARQIIHAISRGFNPEIAMLLEKEDNILEIIDIQDFARKSKAKLTRLRGRCIGNNGKARKLIEQITMTDVSVYGKTVAIIGMVENVGLARKAFESLLQGSKHGNIYKWLEKSRSKLKMRI